MTDTDDIKAGEYELVAVLWDQPLSKPNEPFDFKRHRAGDKVTLNVEEARRLVTAGVVVKPGERERQQVAAAQAQLQAALAAVPLELRELTVEPVEPEQSTPPDDPPADEAADSTVQARGKTRR